MIVMICVLFLLLVLNGVFVAAELAIVATPRASIERLATKGNRRAARVSKILREPQLQDRYIATAQLGITAASLALGMYGEHQLAKIFMRWLAEVELPSWLAAHAAASVIAVVLLTYFHVVLGEMVPKAVALARAERAALWLTPLVRVFEIITYPLITVLDRAGVGILRLFGVARRKAKEHYMSTEELRLVVRESEELGLIGSESANMIDQLFDFGHRTAREAMVPRVKIAGIELGASVSELTRIVLDAPHTRYPVYAKDLDHVIGTVHTRDLLKRLTKKNGLVAADVWPVPFVPESATLNDVLTIMRDRRAHVVIVMDEHGGTAGLLTIETLFAEVVGVIPESAESATLDILPDPRGFVDVAGTLRLDALEREVGVELVHDEVDTVSGLVLALLNRPPSVGDRVEQEGTWFEVLEVEGHGVTRCRVIPPVGTLSD